MSFDEASSRWAGLAVPCTKDTAALHRPRATTDTARNGRSDPVSSSRHRKVTRVRLLPFCEGLRSCWLCRCTPGRRRVDAEGEQIVGSDLPCALSENGKRWLRPDRAPGCKITCHRAILKSSRGRGRCAPLPSEPAGTYITTSTIGHRSREEETCSPTPPGRCRGGAGNEPGCPAFG